MLRFNDWSDIDKDDTYRAWCVIHVTPVFSNAPIHISWRKDEDLMRLGASWDVLGLGFHAASSSMTLPLPVSHFLDPF